MISKQQLLKEFREKSDAFLSVLAITDNKKRANKANKFVTTLRDKYQQQNPDMPIEDLLMLHYVSDIVMLESRQKCWEYDYMAFARRVGELWEPFCKLPILNTKRADIVVYTPPTFSSVQENMRASTIDLINSFQNLLPPQREEIIEHYDEVWGLIDSEAINLKVDLHVCQFTDASKSSIKQYFDIDYKSGFSSNEKGNTNRLLMVAGIYHGKIMTEKHSTLLFVRQKEDQNNHYLQTLKNSGLWTVLCADEVYEQTMKLSGFDVKSWMDHNMNWKEDIIPEFREYLEKNDLIKYLTW